jgi:hypothetical protein
MLKTITLFTLFTTMLFFLNACQQKPKKEEPAKTEADVQVKIAKDKEIVQKEQKDLVNPGEFNDGAKLYRDKMQASCNMSGYMLARKRSKEQWEDIAKTGKLAATIKELCPSVEFKNIWTPDIYEYLHKNAIASR